MSNFPSPVIPNPQTTQNCLLYFPKQLTHTFTYTRLEPAAMSNPLAKFNGYFHDNGDIITEYPARIRHEWEDLGNGAIEAFYQLLVLFQLQLCVTFDRYPQ